MIAKPGIDEVRAAADRIRGYVRTPLLAAAPVKEQHALAGELRLKIEALQVTGSFKARGAINAVFALPPEQLRGGIVTASGGNHGARPVRNRISKVAGTRPSGRPNRSA